MEPEVPEEAETGEAAAEVVVRLPTIRIKTKLKASPKSLIRKAPSMLTYLPVLAGPVLSTGRKGAELHIVQIPWCASG